MSCSSKRVRTLCIYLDPNKENKVLDTFFFLSSNFPFKWTLPREPLCNLPFCRTLCEIALSESPTELQVFGGLALPLSAKSSGWYIVKANERQQVGGNVSPPGNIASLLSLLPPDPHFFLGQSAVASHLMLMRGAGGPATFLVPFVMLLGPPSLPCSRPSGSHMMLE